MQILPDKTAQHAHLGLQHKIDLEFKKTRCSTCMVPNNKQFATNANNPETAADVSSILLTRWGRNRAGSDFLKF
jgi:hypothetical protein